MNGEKLLIIGEKLLRHKGVKKKKKLYNCDWSLSPSSLFLHPGGGDEQK